MLCEQRLDHICNSSDLGQMCGIVAAENQAVLYISLNRSDQSLGDAVGSFLWIAFFQTSIAFGDVLFALQDLTEKWIVDGPGGHAYRAFDDLNVLFLRIHIGLLKSGGCITFFCGDKGRGHLDAVCAQ